MSQLVKPIRFSAAALAACLVLSACGGGDAESPPLASPAPTPTPAPPPPAPPPPAPPPPPIPAGDVLASFDETTPRVIVEFGGAGYAIEAGPAGGSGNALRITRPGGEVFAGAFVTTAPIAFSATRRTITARVFSPTAGVPIVAKAEFADNMGTGDTLPTTAVVAGWQTLTWVFNNIESNRSYTRFTILPNLGTVGSGQSYFFDDITLAPAVAAPPPPAPGAVFLTFDETTPVFTDMGAYGGAVPTVEAGPTGGTGNALKIVKPTSPDTWGGVFFTTPAIPFSTGNKAITARVYSTRANSVITFKVEVPGPGGTSVEVAGSPAVPANTWTDVTWDFSAANLSSSYRVMAITPDVSTVTTGQSYYIDNIRVVASATAPPPAIPTTIATFEEPGAAMVGFEGCWDSTVVNDPAVGATNKVGRILKPGSGVPFYCGATIVTVANGGLQPVAFTNSATTMTVRVWSPTVGIPVRLKVEDIADGTKSVETEATTTTVGWQTLTFNFANAVAGTPVLNLSTTYNKATIFFNFGTLGAGETYYFDDITFVTGTGTNTVLATFDERNFNNTQTQPSILLGFGGAENSTVVGSGDGLPADGTRTGRSARVVKNAGETFAGTSVQRKANDAVPTIPFATDATRMSMRVYSAYAGVRVRLKVEQSGRPDFNSEVDAFTSLVNTWETLTFEFGPSGKHFVPSGPGPNDYHDNPLLTTYQPTSQLDVTRTYNKVNVFFDYGLGLSGYDSSPGTRVFYFDDLRFLGR